MIGEQMCKHCGKKAEIALCKDCWTGLSIKGMWNETTSALAGVNNQYLEILEILHELTLKINNMELQLNLAKRLKV